MTATATASKRLELRDQVARLERSKVALEAQLADGDERLAAFDEDLRAAGRDSQIAQNEYVAQLHAVGGVVDYAHLGEGTPDSQHGTLPWQARGQYDRMVAEAKRVGELTVARGKLAEIRAQVAAQLVAVSTRLDERTAELQALERTPTAA